MTERYSHLDARQIDAVIEAQAVIAGTNKPNEEKTADNFKGLKIVKMPERTATRNGYNTETVRVSR
jgi:hypothetical protein